MEGLSRETMEALKSFLEEQQQASSVVTEVKRVDKEKEMNAVYKEKEFVTLFLMIKVQYV